jgi:hypothetical protein
MLLRNGFGGFLAPEITKPLTLTRQGFSFAAIACWG